MGIACSCSQRLDRVQNSAVGAVKTRPLSLLVTTISPTFGFELLRQELKTYFEENQTYMNKKVLQLFQVAINSPETGLTALQLKMCKMRDIDWEHFSRLVSFGNVISRFLLWKVSLTSKGFCLLCSSMGTFRYLTILTLGELGLGHHQLSLFADGLKKVPQITSLSLPGNELLPEHLETLSPAIMAMANLSQWNLDENLIGDAGCIVLKQTLPPLRKLTLLSVRLNNISHIGCARLIKIAGKKSDLMVHLDGNEIGEEDLERLQVFEESRSI